MTRSISDDFSFDELFVNLAEAADEALQRLTVHCFVDQPIALAAMPDDDLYDGWTV